MARNISISDFLGLNNILPPEQLAVWGDNYLTRYYLKEAKNIDITNDLKIFRRRGFTSAYAGDCHSLWSDNKDMCLFRETSNLRRLQNDLGTTSVIRNGITGKLSMAYLSLNNLVYYSDGNIRGVIENGIDRSWGLEVPLVPSLSVITGGLLFGTYRVALTYTRNDGQESGSSEISLLTISSNQGIRISLTPSSDTSVRKINVYITRRDGELFYRAYSLNNVAQTVDYYNENGLSAINCKTLLLSPPPSGQILEYYNGVIYIGSFDVAWYTLPFRYELTDLSKNFLPFSEDLTLIGAVSDGIYFGTDKEIVFAKGERPEKFQWIKVADYGATFGTMQRDRETERDGTEDKIIRFWSEKGPCIGKISGDFQLITRNTYYFGSASSGASLLHMNRGIEQYITVIDEQGAETEASTGTHTGSGPTGDKLSYRQMDTGGVLKVTYSGMLIIVNSSTNQTLYLPFVEIANIGTSYKIRKLGTGRLTIIASDSDTIDDSAAGGTVYCDDTDEAELNIELVTPTHWITTGTNAWTTT